MEFLTEKFKKQNWIQYGTPCTSTLTILSKFCIEYQPSGEGALAHRLQRRTACKIRYGPIMADGVWKGAYPWGFGHSKQLFYPSTLSMRKGNSRERRKAERRKD